MGKETLCVERQLAMNEKLKLLRIQAINYCMDKGSQGNLSEEVSQKFAELIIQECIDTIKNNENISLNISNFTDEKKQGIQLGLEFAICDIQEHFGV